MYNDYYYYFTICSVPINTIIKSSYRYTFSFKMSSTQNMFNKYVKFIIQ